MEKKLFKYIWQHTRLDQIKIALVVLVAQVSYFISLGIPKTIVDDAMQGKAFQKDGYATFLEISFDLPTWLGGKIHIFDGIRFNNDFNDRFQFLMIYCLLFLLFVVINGGLKQRANTLAGRLGERMLRRLRYELFDRALRFPLHHFRKVRSAEIATMIKDEVDPIGGFIGAAFTTPMLLGGSALTALYFIFTQSGWLALGTVATLAVQLAIIPRLRRKVLELGRQRQLTARQLAGRIAECVEGANEIHAGGTSNYERADIVSRLGKIFRIRFELYQRKFFVKYLNNMIAQITPFIYYSVGGYLVLTQRMEFGSVFAAIQAYKDLPSPIKDLIDWDQQRQDAQIKYEQVTDQFDVEGTQSPEFQKLGFEGEIKSSTLQAQFLTYTDETGAKILDGVSFDVEYGQHLAIAGPSGSGKEILGQIISRLYPPDTGKITLGEHDWLSLPEPMAATYFSYLGDETYLFPNTIGENIAYGLKIKPVLPATYSEEEKAEKERDIEEALNAGNPILDLQDEWLDYKLAGVTNLEELRQIAIDLLIAVEFDEDVFQFGLRGRVDPDQKPELAAAFLEARKKLRISLQDPEYGILVEPFDPKKYNHNMTIAENLFFGTTKDGTVAFENLADHPYFQSVLKETGLDQELLKMGAKIAETMVELFADLPPGHPFFEQFSFIAQEDLPNFEQLLSRIGKTIESPNLKEKDRQRLIGLSFPYIEARHRLDLVDSYMEEKIVKAREVFAKNIDPSLSKLIEFYNPTEYNSAASVQDNILFGRLVYGHAKAAHKIGKLIAHLIEELGMRAKVIEVGFGFNVGTGGKRLSALQRQKIALVRALLKRPEMLVLNLSLAIFDEVTQRRLIEAIRQIMQNRTLIVVVDNPTLARLFDRAVLLRSGRVAEHGRLAEIDKEGSYLRDLAGEAR